MKTIYVSGESCGLIREIGLGPILVVQGGAT
jgi:hypothetical protein